MKQAGLTEESKAAAGPAVKMPDGNEEEETELEDWEKTEFRGECALLNYLGQDRSDIQWATNQICREMAKPTVGSRSKVKRVVRYLVGAESVVWKFSEFEAERRRWRLDLHVDSDWAKGEDRKSTSGGMVMLEGAGIKHWSRTQKTRALSSGEAEYYALVSGCAEALGVQSLASDLGYDLEVVVVYTDSDACRGIASRRGLGKMRHVELKYLWVQEVVKAGRLRVKRVDGLKNIADHLTKAKSGMEMATILKEAAAELRMRDVDRSGRAV